MDAVVSILRDRLLNKEVKSGCMHNRTINGIVYANLESEVYLCHYDLHEIVRGSYEERRR